MSILDGGDLVYKKIFAAIFCAVFLVSSTSFAADEKVLKASDIGPNIEKSLPLKQFDIKYRKFVNTHTKVWEMTKYINIDLQKLFIQQLNAPVAEPTTIYYMGVMPVTVYPGMSGIDKQKILDSMGIPYTDKGRLKADLSKNLTPSSLSSQLNLMPKNREVLKNTLEITAQDIYNNILLLEESIKLQQEILVNTKSQLDLTNEKAKKGRATKKDAESLNLQYEQAKIKIDSQERSKDNLILTLNKIMGVPIGTKYDKIDGEIKYGSLGEINTDEMVEKALKNRLEILNAKESVRLKDYEFDIVKKYYDNDTYPEYRVVVKEQDKERQKLDKVTEEIKLEITKACETVKENYYKIDVAQMDVKKAEAQYDLLNEKVQKGQLTKDILDSTHIQITAAKLKLYSAMNAYNISIKKLDAAVGVGPKFD